MSCTVTQPQYLLPCNLADDFTSGLGSTSRGHSADGAETINTLWSYGDTDSASPQATTVIYLLKKYNCIVYLHPFFLFFILDRQWIASACWFKYVSSSLYSSYARFKKEREKVRSLEQGKSILQVIFTKTLSPAPSCLLPGNAQQSFRLHMWRPWVISIALLFEIAQSLFMDQMQQTSLKFLSLYCFKDWHCTHCNLHMV